MLPYFLAEQDWPLTSEFDFCLFEIKKGIGKQFSCLSSIIFCYSFFSNLNVAKTILCYVPVFLK